MGLLDGKNALVFGLANERSIAWGIARSLAEGGAALGLDLLALGLLAGGVGLGAGLAAGQQGIQELEELALGGLLLDIGKIRLPPDLIEREGDLPADPGDYVGRLNRLLVELSG